MLERIFKPKRQPITLDYTQRRAWGHDITWRPTGDGRTLRGSLWHPTRPRPGDWLLLPDQGRRVLYRLTEVRPCMDPDDMYGWTAEWVPRAEAPEIPEDTCRERMPDAQP